jgi:hypothetical protein
MIGADLDAESRLVELLTSFPWISVFWGLIIGLSLFFIFLGFCLRKLEFRAFIYPSWSFLMSSRAFVFSLNFNNEQVFEYYPSVSTRAVAGENGHCRILGVYQTFGFVGVLRSGFSLLNAH